MLLHLPFNYPVTFRKPRKRTDSKAVVRSTIDVVIPDVPREDVELVLRYHHDWHLRQTDALKTAPIVDLIHYAGTTWRNAIGPETRDGTRTPLADEAMLKAALAQEKSYHERYPDLAIVTWPHRITDAQHGAERADRIEDLDIKDIIEDGREATEAVIRERAATFLFCDGLLYRQGPEPKIHVTNVYKSKEEPYALAIMPVIDPQEIDKENVSRADRAEQLFKDYGGRRNELDRDLFFAGAPEVFRPDLLRYDDMGIAFRKTARNVLKVLTDNVTKSQEIFQAQRAFETAVADMDLDLANVDRNVRRLVQSAKTVEEFVKGQSSYVAIGYMIKIGEGELAARIADSEAIEGIVNPFVESRPIRTTFHVDLMEGADNLALEAALVEAGAASAITSESWMEVVVDAIGVQAEEQLQAILEKAREAVYPPTGLGV